MLNIKVFIFSTTIFKYRTQSNTNIRLMYKHKEYEAQKQIEKKKHEKTTVREQMEKF